MKSALKSVLKCIDGKTFVEVGCGRGDLAYELCSLGYRGFGVDMSPAALKEARLRNARFISQNALKIIDGNVLDETFALSDKVDFALSAMVMEHVKDDLKFLMRMREMVRPHGRVIIFVPGRKDLWGIEDESVGHFRRYDHEDLLALFSKAGLTKIQILSVAVPIANFLMGLSNWLVKKEVSSTVRHSSKEEQTLNSGILEIPFKTVFPIWAKLLLNKYTMGPLLLLQRLFFHSRKGVVLLAYGEVS